ncbi:hypothetical protein LCGC14_0298190 [marine sediment metagenome]|uniref:Nucleotidyltransferase n=1 Tax=marine sediment metagenome TaxID=412755 RepID=A0A0F9TR91_9ZZZZ
MIPKPIYDKHQSLSDWSILLGYRGSIAHGMYVPNTDPNSIDDKDVMGIVVPPRDYYYGLKTFGSKGTKEITDGEWDIVLFELTKAVRLLAKGNPNILQILWLKENYYIKITPAGQLLIDNRELFVGKHVYHSFVGYAHGQLHKMTHCPGRGYMGAKRKRLVEKFGYDTKNASHLVRLLRLGIEFLCDGELQVERPDAQELLAIKRGEWPLEKIEAEAARLFEVAQEALTHSPLPPKPETEKINALCVDIAECWLSDKE